MKLADCARYVVTGLLILLTGYNTYLVNRINGALNEKVVIVTDKIDSLAINTNGKLQDLEHKYSALANVKNTTIVQKEVVYTAKTDQEDADVELKTEKPVIKFKVNDGPTYKFDLLENENSKFADGKLVIASSSTSNLDITTDEYRKAKWSLTTAANSDKKVMAGLGYTLGHSVTANIFVGQHMKPYYGLTWSIGNYSKK